MPGNILITSFGIPENSFTQSAFSEYLQQHFSYGFVPLLSCFIISLIAINAIRKGWGNKLVRIVVLFCFSLVIWTLMGACLILFPRHGYTPHLMHFFFAAWLFIPSLFYHFVNTFCERKKVELIPVYMGSVLLLSIELFGNVTYLQHNYFGLYPKLTGLYAFAVTVYYFTTCGLGLILLYQEYMKSEESIRRHQARLLWLGTSVGYLVSLSELLYMSSPNQIVDPLSYSLFFHVVNYGIQLFIVIVFSGYLFARTFSVQRSKVPPGETNFFNDLALVFLSSIVFYFLILYYAWGLYPISSFGLFIAIFLISYAILKYRFMDMGELVRRFMVNILLSTIFACIYVLLIAGLTPRKIDMLPSLLFVVLLVFIFNPLYVRLQKMVNRLFFSHKYDYQRTIKDVSIKVVTVMEHKKLIEIIKEAIIETLRVRTFVLFLYEEQNETYQPIVLHGIDRDNTTDIPAYKDIVRIIQESDGSLFKAEILTSNQEYKHGDLKAVFEKFHTTLIIPMFLKGFLRGMLWLGDKQTGDIFTRTDIDLLQILSNQTVIALDNARLYELAITDDLTRLYIVRYFHQKLYEMILNSARSRGPLSILIIDLDHFKSVNDTYGHIMGDTILRQSAMVFQEVVRLSDLVARYGGEEFGVLLPETSNEMALSVAERIREAIEYHRFPQNIRQTLSIGVATIEGNHIQQLFQNLNGALTGDQRRKIALHLKEKLIRTADEALYGAKAAGRNRCHNGASIICEERDVADLIGLPYSRALPES